MNMSFSSFKLLRVAFGVLLALLVVNVIVLDVIMLKRQGQKESEIAIKTDTKADMRPLNKIDGSKDACPNSCISYIKEVISTPSVQQDKGTITQQVVVPTVSSGLLQIREFFIPLGTGSVGTDDWTDILGTQVTIDSTKYGGIKTTVVFEASVYIPTGTGRSYVRLYNVTDKHPVWFSELSLEGGDPKVLTSPPITLDNGAKAYLVQMKNTLKTQTSLTQARIRITVE